MKKVKYIITLLFFVYASLHNTFAHYQPNVEDISTEIILPSEATYQSMYENINIPSIDIQADDDSELGGVTREVPVSGELNLFILCELYGIYIIRSDKTKQV